MADCDLMRDVCGVVTGGMVMVLGSVLPWALVLVCLVTVVVVMYLVWPPATALLLPLCKLPFCGGSSPAPGGLGLAPIVVVVLPCLFCFPFFLFFFSWRWCGFLVLGVSFIHMRQYGVIAPIGAGPCAPLGA